MITDRQTTDRQTTFGLLELLSAAKNLGGKGENLNKHRHRYATGCMTTHGTSLSPGQEYVIEINDCAMGLMGDGQDEDRKLIAELVIKEMEVTDGDGLLAS